MLNNYISPALITELKTAFPNKLPNKTDFDNRITLEQIAFNAGFQACIRYLEEQAELQNQSAAEEIKIL